MTDSANKLPEATPPINEELLLKYIHKEMNEEEQRAFEQQLASSQFLSDAEEGLRLVPETKQVSAIAQQINQKMQNSLRRKKGKIKRTNPEIFLIVSVILLLFLLLTLCFLYLMRLKTG